MSSRTPPSPDPESGDTGHKFDIFDALDVALRLAFPLIFVLWPFASIYLRDAYPLTDPALNLRKLQIEYAHDPEVTPGQFTVAIQVWDAEHQWIGPKAVANEATANEAAPNAEATGWLYARAGDRKAWALIGPVHQDKITFSLAPGYYEVALVYPLQDFALEAPDAAPYPIYPFGTEYAKFSLKNGGTTALTFRLAHHAASTTKVPLRLATPEDNNSDPGDLLYGVRYEHVLEATREGMSIIFRQPKVTHTASGRNAAFGGHDSCTVSWQSNDLEIVTREWTMEQIEILEGWVEDVRAHPCCDFRGSEAASELNRMIETYHASRPGMRWYEWLYATLIAGLFIFWGIRAIRDKEMEGFAWVVLAPAIGLQVMVFIGIAVTFWITGYNYLYHLYAF